MRLVVCPFVIDCIPEIQRKNGEQLYDRVVTDSTGVYTFAVNEYDYCYLYYYCYYYISFKMAL